MKLLVTSLLLTLCISAADFSGKWTGSFIESGGDHGTQTAVIVLKQDGKTVTGTAGPTAEEQHPITNGKVDGDTVTFDVSPGDGSMHFSLKLVGTHLKGDVQGEGGGEKHSATIDVTRSE